MCGEHLPSVGDIGCIEGSSPRVRGTPPEFVAMLDVNGIIPACAGNTCLADSDHYIRWDHPRVCGEHTPYAGVMLGNQGSSPRVRGTL